ncbi:hypothetical protein IMSHALPRED_008097 [Imshaugia aleurites]|uniref:CFEM domain-containing protein n=1 Tax=Imshaugia aleurites TaxID=172621 RepID=A0A8H3FSW6_9LECA|nr:hypothetical protein IMSHALPRED_008097 [Imshaugia aleurites]
MKYSITALALLAAPFASASGLDARASQLTELPPCAQAATQSGISATGCEISDFACICGNSQFVTSLHNIIETKCSVADQQVTLAFAADVCDAVGVTLNISSPSATTSSAVLATTSAAVPSASESAGAASSSASAPASAATPSAPYAFANGSSSLNGTNATIPFTGDAAERTAIGYQLAGTALSIAVVMGCFL